jgi:hypothetical protein
MSDPIMPDRRVVLCFSVVVRPSHGGLWSRLWLPHQPITQR